MEINTRSASNSAIGKTENGTYIYDSATTTDRRGSYLFKWSKN